MGLRLVAAMQLGLLYYLWNNRNHNHNYEHKAHPTNNADQVFEPEVADGRTTAATSADAAGAGATRSPGESAQARQQAAACQPWHRTSTQ